MFPSWAQRYVGLPYQEHGRTWDGLDCYGLCLLIWKNEFGITGLPDPQYAGITEELRALKDGLGEWTRIDQPDPGDAVVFRVGARPLHIGIVVGEDRMLHIEGPARNGRPKLSSCERYASPLWRSRLEGFYRHVGG